MYTFFLKYQMENITKSFAFWHLGESLVKQDLLYKQMTNSERHNLHLF